MYLIYSTFDKQFLQDVLANSVQVFTREIQDAKLFGNGNQAFTYCQDNPPVDGEFVILYTEHSHVIG